MNKRWLLAGVALLAVLLVGGGVALWLRHPLPASQPGAEADALARRMQTAVDMEAWARTGAVRWSFQGRDEVLWDRTRNLARVRRGNEEVLLDLERQTGLAWYHGELQEGDKREEAVQRAYGTFVNDAFWLNPMEKFFDPGVERSLAADGSLVVHFTRGGVTPGDRYQFFPGPDGKPRAWRMWVSIFLVGGIEATWTDWRRLVTGAMVCTRHSIGGVVTVPVDHVDGRATLRELVGERDPFDHLVNQATE
ncbi:MAG: hypothetical protein HY909_10865 [Deltaproteobacteria bacterium]|nr:hypothetical protein [Deltaproteobacteria bacterium]